ncbi:MAG: efflux RND transporter permease subunit [Rubrivivax sp.]|nr:efflux RND transporter permease subunit [Rubrivivax sp.]
MLAKIIQWSGRNPFLILLATLFIVIGGIVAVMKTPLDALPDLSDVQVIVYTEVPGQAPQVVEDQVTYPLTTAMLAVPKSKVLRGFSFFGASFVYVIFEDGTDIYWARSRVLEYLNFATSRLPKGVSPSLGPDATGVGWVYQYALLAKNRTLAELRTIQDWYVRYQLTKAQGVAEVASLGGFVQTYQVTVDPLKLRSYGIPLMKVAQVIRDSNRDVGGRVVEMAETEYMVRGKGYLRGKADIEMLVVKSEGGTPVLVRDVARVEMTPDERRGLSELNGEGEVVSGIAMSRFGQNALEVIHNLKSKVNEISAGLPEGVTIEAVYDRSDLIHRAIDTLKRTLIEESLIVALVCVVFLMHVRSALVAILMLPVGVLIAFIAMRLLGMNSNLMSLGGIAIAIGAMIDAAIVMIENAHKHLERLDLERPGHTLQERADAMLDACKEVGPALFFSLLIITVSFLPIFTLEAQEGRLFKPLAWTKTFAMAAAALLSVTLVPALMVLFVRGRIVAEARNPINRALIWLYRPVIALVLRARLLTVALALVILASAVVPLKRIGTEFMPKLDEGAILVTTRRMPSVDLQDATRLSLAAERITKRFPEVLTVVTKEGRPDLATEAMGLFEGDMYVILKPRSEWTTAKDREGLVAALDSALQVLPGVDVSFTQPLAMRLDEAESGIKTDLGIKVVGPDLEQNQRVAERLRRIVATVPGSADVAVEVAEGSGQVRMQIRREVLAQYGVSVADVRDAIDYAMGSQTAAELIDGFRRIGVVVRLPEAYRADAAAIGRITVRAPGGELVPLSALTAMVSTTGPELIGHEDAQRRSLVLSNVRGRDLGSFVGEVRARIANEVTLPNGVFLEWGGQYENQQRAMARLELVVPLALLLIFGLLYLSFRSVPQAVLVLSNVPFALVGGIAALWLRGLNLNLSASIGFIALFGIAVLNGVVMVEHLNHLRHDEGLLDRSVQGRVRQGAADRLRPVLMTALVASLGFVPMALSTSPGSEVQRPLASVVIGGLITSTVLTLFVLPVLYAWLEARRPVRVRRAGTVPLVVERLAE